MYYLTPHLQPGSCNTYNSLYKETWDHQDDDRNSVKDNEKDNKESQISILHHSLPLHGSPYLSTPMS